MPKSRVGTFGKKFGRFGKKKISVAESSSAGEYLDPQTDLDHRPPPPIPGASGGTPEVEGKVVLTHTHTHTHIHTHTHTHTPRAGQPVLRSIL